MFIYLIYFYFLVEAPSAVNDFDDGEEWVTVSKKTAGGVNTQKKGTNDDYLELF